MGNADSSAADGDDRPCFERAAMSSEYVAHQGNALRRGNIWEAHQAGMLEASHVHEFSEIGVYRQQNPVFRSGACEQCLIPRIGSELAGLEDVMILGTQPVGQLWAGTAIDEELHGSATEMADSVS